MGRNGTVNMTELKDATGVVSNSLPAHNPEGTSPTRFGHFLVEELGGNLDPSTSTDVDGLKLRPFDVIDDTGTSRDASGSYSNGFWEFSTTGVTLDVGWKVLIEIWFERNSAPNLPGRDGKHARAAFFNDPSKWGGKITRLCQINSITSKDSGSDYISSALEIEVTATGGTVEVFLGWDPDLNTDMANANSSLNFKTKDVVGSSSDFDVSIDSFFADSNSIDVNYTVGDGVTDYECELRETDNGNNNPAGLVDSETLSSDTSSTMTHSNADTSITHTYEVRVTDDFGNGNTETDTRQYRALNQ
jgi:hypothetical protein